MLRVLHIVGPLEVGGAQTQLLGLIRAAAQGAWQPALCSLSPGPMLPAFRGLGIPMFELERGGSPGLLRMAAVRHHLATREYDVLHAVLPFAGVYAKVAVIGRAQRPAVVIAERDVEPRSLALLLANFALAPWTDMWVANSGAVAEATQRSHPVRAGSLVVLPNAIDRAVFYPGPPVEPFRTPRIGSLGRLSFEKGHDVLIEAVRRLGAEVDVEIAGTGPEENHLRGIAQGLPIRFLGALAPGPEVASFLRSLDVFVLPSRREGLPNALLEAQACGVPVLASDIPAIRESVLHAGARLVRSGDPASLSRALNEVLEDRELRAEARKVVDAVLGFEELAERYEAVFEQAVRRVRA